MSDFVQEFFTSRQNYADGNTRIGQLDRLWYDSITNTIRISDGITPGGIIVSGGSGFSPGASGYSGYSGQAGLSGYSGAVGLSGYSGSGITNWIKISSNYIAANGDKIIADTTGGSFIVDLPATPELGYFVQIFGPALGTNSLNVNGNGATIEGTLTDITLTDSNTIYDFIYDGNTWQLSAGGGGVGVSGYSGYSGTIGISGYSGLAGNNNLIWTEAGNYRTLTAYRSVDATVTPIRTAEFFDNLLRLTLASFTPTLGATPAPSATLNWDIPITGFTVTVINPDDILDQYISNVSYLTATSGSVSVLSDFTAGSKSAIPAPTVDWNQTFTTGITGYIRSNSNSISGGSSSVNVFFKYVNGGIEQEYTSGNAVINVNWNTPAMSATLGTLSGSTFLATYNSVGYTITVTNVSNSGNYVNTVTAIGGTISNPSGSGTFTFTTPVNKNNVSDVRTISNTTVLTRPVAVTGISYTASLSTTTSNPSITFTYPTLWVWTVSTYVVPVRSTYVLGTGFQPGVTVLGNQVKTFAAYVNNTDAVPRGFWFAVRSAASQPTIFKTGASPSLLNDVTVTTGNTVNLEPDSPPVGYIAESYTLYGITLQPGSTYVSIS